MPFNPKIFYKEKSVNWAKGERNWAGSYAEAEFVFRDESKLTTLFGIVSPSEVLSK